MKISTEIATASNHFGEEKAIEYIAKAGFDAWDFSMFAMCKRDENRNVLSTDHPLSGKNYLKFARQLKKVGEDCGIHCNQSHAPYPTDGDEILPYLMRAIECTAEAGGKICVIHPKNRASAKENALMFNYLLPFAKDCKVKIATENMWLWKKDAPYSSFAACATSESFKEHIDLINDEYFGACLDIGHAEMQGSGSGAYNMIKALDKSLIALHIHDNDRVHDSHAIPFSMNIDFEKVIKALKEINYSGYLTLEADQHLKKFTKENAFEGIKELQSAAKKLSDMFESR